MTKSPVSLWNFKDNAVMNAPDMQKVRAAVKRLGLDRPRFTEEPVKKGDKTPVDAARRKTFKSRGDGNPFYLYNSGFAGRGGFCD